MKIISNVVTWFKECWWMLLLMVVIFIIAFFVSGMYDCWFNGNCPPPTNITKNLLAGVCGC